jgi:MOSC domain-containing protein YiiM
VVFPVPSVVAVSAAKKHRFSKAVTNNITLLAGLGVAGDAHCGAYVQHLYEKARNPTQPNLRQVHLIEQELLNQLKADGYAVGPGQLGENIMTYHLNLLELKVGTVLQLGENAQVRITGPREPSVKIDRFQRGLQKAVTARRGGHTFMKGAAMGIVIASGMVSVGDIILMRPFADELSSPFRSV